MKMLRGLVPAYLLYWGLFRLLYPAAGRWHEALVLAFLALGLALAALHEAVSRRSPEGAIWFILGSKVFRLLASVAALVLVRLLHPDVPIIPFAVDLIGIYLFSLGYEIYNEVKGKKQK